MKGKELIKLIQDNNLEEYDVKVIFVDGYKVYPVFKTLEVEGLGDKGHSEQVFYLDCGELDE